MSRIAARYAVQFWRHHFLNSPWFQNLEETACDELQGRLYNVRDFSPDSSLITVQSIVRPLTKTEARQNGRPHAERTHACIEFQALEVDRQVLADLIASDQESVEKYVLDCLIDLSVAAEIETFCDILMFLVSLSFCGPFNAEPARIHIGRRHISTGFHRLVGIDRAPGGYEFLHNGIQPVLEFERVLTWSKRCGGIWDGVARTNIEKAVSLISHTFNSSESSSEVAKLIWSTAGLEAVACDSNNSISGQLRRRLPMLCDLLPFKDVKKLISDAYSFRSRLFHGDIPIMNSFNENDSSYEEHRYDAKLPYFGLALQIMLLAVIWKAIQNESVNIEFYESPRFI